VKLALIKGAVRLRCDQLLEGPRTRGIETLDTGFFGAHELPR